MDEIKKQMSEWGRKGGRSKSPKKIAAVMRNLLAANKRVAEIVEKQNSEK